MSLAATTQLKSANGSSLHRRGSPMEPGYWIPENVRSLLDVGCNTGALLQRLHSCYPELRLAGVDINHSALEIAKRLLPDLDIHEARGPQLPFEDQSFECATCIEVIEHVPEAHRRQFLEEIHRVLTPGGTLILRCPHAGVFSWLDAQNFRFRFPKLYKTIVGRGNRDLNYEQAQEELVWHHHFTKQELIDLAGASWRLEACQLGAFVLFPIMDILRWPFYRMKRGENWFVRTCERIASAELAVNFGNSSYDILLVLTKAPDRL